MGAGANERRLFGQHAQTGKSVDDHFQGLGAGKQLPLGGHKGQPCGAAKKWRAQWPGTAPQEGDLGK